MCHFSTFRRGKCAQLCTKYPHEGRYPQMCTHSCNKCAISVRGGVNRAQGTYLNMHIWWANWMKCPECVSSRYVVAAAGHICTHSCNKCAHLYPFVYQIGEIPIRVTSLPHIPRIWAQLCKSAKTDSVGVTHEGRYPNVSSRHIHALACFCGKFGRNSHFGPARGPNPIK